MIISYTVICVVFGFSCFVAHDHPNTQKLLFLDTVEGVATALRPYWAEATKDRATVVQAVPDMLEIVPSGTSKGNGVRMLLDHLGASPEEVRANNFFFLSHCLIINQNTSKCVSLSLSSINRK